ncbi:hypothetical protein ACRAWD_26865 [Caulobacter segnis]
MLGADLLVPAEVLLVRACQGQPIGWRLHIGHPRRAQSAGEIDQ